jgi:hypothetical protein
MLTCSTGRLTLSCATLQSLALFSFSAGMQAAATSTLPNFLLASTTLAKLLCDIVWQLGRRIPRVLAFGFLGDVISQLLLLFFVFNPAPAVIDLVSTNRFRCFRHVLRILLVLNPGGDQAKLIAVLCGELASVFTGIVIAIDVNGAAFLSAELTNSRVAPIPIGSAAIDVAAAIVADVSAIKCVDDSGAVASAVPDAAATGE